MNLKNMRECDKSKNTCKQQIPIVYMSFNNVGTDGVSGSLWVTPTSFLKKPPVGTRFFASVQNGPGAHPASYTTSTVSFPGVKLPGRGVDLPPI